MSETNISIMVRNLCFFLSTTTKIKHVQSFFRFFEHGKLEEKIKTEGKLVGNDVIYHRHFLYVAIAELGD